MSQHKAQLLPALSFGSGRTGKLAVSLGKRGRVVVKGDGSFSRRELRALLSQISWFLEQAEAADAAPTPPPKLAPQAPPPAVWPTHTTGQLSLLPNGGVPSAEDSAYGTSPTGTLPSSKITV